LLSSPPKDYESFVVAIETRDNVPAFENLCLTLKEKGERRDGGNKTSEQALVARQRPRRGKPTVQCYKCSERGHIPRNCLNNGSAVESNGRTVRLTVVLIKGLVVLTVARPATCVITEVVSRSLKSTPK